MKYFNTTLFTLCFLVLSSCKEERPETIVPEPEEPSITTEESILMSQNFAKDESLNRSVCKKKHHSHYYRNRSKILHLQRRNGKYAAPGKVVL